MTRRVDDCGALVDASGDGSASVEEGGGTALLTSVEDGCEPPWVPEGVPAILM